MKKLVAFAAVIAAVSFTSCGNKNAESNAVAETENAAVVEEPAAEVAPADSAAVEVAPADSAAVEAAPAE